LSVISSLLSGLGNLDVDGSSVDLLLVQKLDGVLSVGLAVHLDESISERSGSSGDDVRADYFSSDFEFGDEFIFLGVER